MMKVITFEEIKLRTLEARVNEWLSKDEFAVVDIKFTAYGSDAVASRYVAMIVYTED